MSAYAALNRPRTVTITFWSVIFLGTWNLGRAIALGQQLTLQQALKIQPDPGLRLGAAILFGVLFYGLAGLLWRKRPFVITAIPLTVAGYTVYELIIWLLFAQPPRNWALWLITSLFLVGTTMFTRWALRRAANAYFQDGKFE